MPCVVVILVVVWPSEIAALYWDLSDGAKWPQYNGNWGNNILQQIAAAGKRGVDVRIAQVCCHTSSSRSSCSVVRVCVCLCVFVCFCVFVFVLVCLFWCLFWCLYLCVYVCVYVCE